MSVQIVSDQFEISRNFDFHIGRLDNNYMYVSAQNQGLGTNLFLNQVLAASHFGFKKIHLTAMGPEDGLNWFGYYFWAILGFENTDIKEYRAWASERGRDEPTLSELVQSESGRALWKNAGFTWIGDFHLKAGHPCLHYLQKFLDRKNIDFDLPL